MSDVILGNRFMGEGLPFYIHRTMHDRENIPLTHGHDFVELVYVHRGEGSHSFEGGMYSIKTGDVYIINPGEEHTYAFKGQERIEIINCLFKPALIHDTLLKELDITHSMDYFYVHPFLKPDDRFNHRLNLEASHAAEIEIILESMRVELELRASGFGTIIRLRMIELLLLLSRYYHKGQKHKQGSNFPEQDLMFMRIRGYLERNYNRKIKLTNLVDIFHISERHLNRLVNRHTGMSVISFLHRIRIEQAKIILEETEEKIITVASMVGYEDPAFFCKLFSRLEGCPPSKYRKIGDE